MRTPDAPDAPPHIVPFTMPLPLGATPVVDRLGIVGPARPEIGQVVLACSTFDVDGYAIAKGDDLIASASARRWVGVLPALAASTIFGALVGLGALIALGSLGAWVAIVAFALLFVGFRRLFGPERGGWSAVVGSEGFQIGLVAPNGALEQTVVRYADPTDVWFEKLANVHVRPWFSPVRPLVGPGQMAREELWIRDADGSLHASLGHMWDHTERSRRSFDGVRPAMRPAHERAQVFWEVQRHGHAVRIEAALARLTRGERCELPAGRDGTLALSLDRDGAPTMTLRSGNAVRLTGPVTGATVSLAAGVYGLRGASGERAEIARAELGDAFVLDALVAGRPRELPAG